MKRSDSASFEVVQIQSQFTLQAYHSLILLCTVQRVQLVNMLLLQVTAANTDMAAAIRVLIRNLPEIIITSIPGYPTDNMYRISNVRSVTKNL